MTFVFRTPLLFLLNFVFEIPILSLKQQRINGQIFVLKSYSMELCWQFEFHYRRIDQKPESELNSNSSFNYDSDPNEALWWIHIKLFLFLFLSPSLSLVTKKVIYYQQQQLICHRNSFFSFLGNLTEYYHYNFRGFTTISTFCYATCKSVRFPITIFKLNIPNISDEVFNVIKFPIG